MRYPRQFPLLIKPASADCNLRCRYCFYLDHLDFYPGQTHRMTEQVLERLVSSYMVTPQKTYAFIWQGGEPTLMGVDFFRKVVEFQQKYAPPGAAVANMLQTNGTLLNDEMVQLFAEYRFLIGISLDGPPDLHDRYRKTGGSVGTHDRVVQGIRLLQRHDVDFNVLVLVSQANIGRPREVYRYLVDQGLLFHQYIPCVETDASGQLCDYSITGDGWGLFLCGIFDEWKHKDTRRVSVRLFDSVIQKLVNGVPTDCSMGSDCRQYFTVEFNGDVYPCDFFVRHDLELGNLFTHTWKQIADSDIYAEFGRRKLDLHVSCRECCYLDLCYGDCPRTRVHSMGIGDQPGQLCSGWKVFLRHSLPTFKKLAEELKTELRLPPCR